MPYSIQQSLHLTEEQHHQVNQLWQQEFPASISDQYSTLYENAKVLQHYYLEEEKVIIAWAVAFEKDNEKRFSILISRNMQRKGLGKRLLQCLLKQHPDIYAWVVESENYQKQDGSSYLSPLSFYLNLGFELIPNTVIETPLLKTVKIKSPLHL